MTQDKRYHFAAGALTAMVVGLPCSVSLWTGLWAALSAGILVGGVKEWCDNKYNWKWDWLDFACTCLGAVLVAVFIIMLHFGKG